MSRQRPLSTPPRPWGGVYLHVPFCASLCSYCHFPRTARHDAADRARMVDAVLDEFALRSEGSAVLRRGLRPAATLYVGGGTPSVLEPALFHRLIEGTWGRLTRLPGAEATAEANPESFTAERAEAWAACGINRVSVGVQSLEPDVLARLGRRAGPDDARRALRLAAARFDRVSADWILAPGCTAESLGRQFAEARDLGVDHVSFYILELHAGTQLAADIEAGRVAAPDEDETARVYLAARETLERLGYRQYEVSNFCLPGAESRHNAAYWRRTPYLGLGPGAHGLCGPRRYANEPDPARYLARIAAGELPEAESERLTPAQRRIESIVLPLRTRQGVPLTLLDASEAWLERGRVEGLWRIEGGRLSLTGRGLLLIDTVEEWLTGSV